ncbi:AAA family ATPase [Amycolatopsis cihanbeyliensis]|uniref:Putative ATPase n=1 Tax=Amycolatopsis cihanbeyliensis TaxID=1128664 RepID=A0A542CT15_AMYCI|nr:AAA family ATPase [Amycolatopsis cihanbeyliensis]TQI93945.1 putative ATPase [Amycolatopsis cihanbeyliensis]
MMAARGGSKPAIERLHIRNYRVLRDVTFEKLTPLTVLFGPNGSGKSTVFDVFAFLHEAFTTNLRRAWDARNRMAEIRSRGMDGPVEFELKYRDPASGRLITYQLAIDEDSGSPTVVGELLRWTVNPGQGRPTEILNFSRGEGAVYDEQVAAKVSERLDSPDLLAVSSLGQLSRYPQVAALRRFITGWYLSYLNIDQVRQQPMSGPQEKLSVIGDNLANVIQYLGERHPERLETIFEVLGQRVPSLERVDPEQMPDGRLLLRLKDRPFDKPVLAQFISDGTLKLLAYLTVLYDPDPAPIVGIEEPENQLHPKLLYSLAEEARAAAGRSQMLVTTHSPYFADALRPEELWALYRADDGFTRSVRASGIQPLVAMADAGGTLGSLWMEGYFDVADPLTRSGRPA